jgi:ribose-phosphate pyrophosphokinase
MKVFALNSSRDLGEHISRSLGIPLSSHEERAFEDGEHKVRSLVNVRNSHVFVIQSLNGDPTMSVNDKLCRLLFFVGSLKDAAASRVTVIAPYLCYARKDRKTKSRDPVTTKYIAQLFEAVGTDCLVTIDVHNLQAFQNSFRCNTEHLEAKNLFVNFFSKELGKKDLAIMSPDFGGAKRAEQFRQSLGGVIQKDVPFVFMEKQRSKDVISGEMMVGDVKGRTVVILDDLISSGGTLVRAAKACHQQGAREVYAAATPPVFSKQANDILNSDVLQKIVVTDSVPLMHLNPEVKKKIVVISVAPLLARAIESIYHGKSIVELLGNE